MSEPQFEAQFSRNRVPSRRLSDDHGMLFDLNAEAASLGTQEDCSSENELRKTSMLVKYPELRIALVTMRAGATWDDHKTDARISVQPLRGQIKFKTSGSTVDLRAGQLLVLDPGMSHSVEAIEESAFLLTIVPLSQK
jgi:quercetin dioxygenase-like cupin family protein